MLCLLGTGPALAGTESDTVNERFPVNPLHKEQQWRVDCARAWAELDCNASAELRREIELCGMIYQPPAGQPLHRCPDYRKAVQQLDAGNCTGLDKLATAARACDQK